MLHIFIEYTSLGGKAANEGYFYHLLSAKYDSKEIS